MKCLNLCVPVVVAFFFHLTSFAVQADQSEAPAKVVRVYCDRVLGPSQVKRALWFGGDMMYWQETDESQLSYILKSWKALQPEGVALDTALLEWVHIRRNAKGSLEIDFKEYDQKMTKTLHLLNVRPENVQLIFEVPKELSFWQTDNYTEAMPRDLDEWKWYVDQVIRHNLQKKWKVQNYGVAGEPDYGEKKSNSHKGGNFSEHVKLFAATCQAAERADPTVKIWTPGTMNWQGTKYTQGSPTLAEWIREVARYNARVSPEERLKLTRIAWQDYAWSSDKLSDGSQAVKAMLAKNGFQATEFGLGPSGWGSWCDDYLDQTLPPHRRSSYVVSNVIREFKTPQPDIGLMSYFVYRADPCLGHGGELFRIAAVTSNCIDPEGGTNLTPIYAGFEAIAKLRDGQLVETDSSSTGLEAMAVINKESLPVIILNNHGPEAVEIKLEVHGAPFPSGKFNHVTQRIDEAHSRGGKKGLEDGIWGQPAAMAETIEISEIVEPYGTVVETLWPDYSP